MNEAARILRVPLDRGKFSDPDVTAKGEPRASVALAALKTLWINTGTLCNLACANCYIESSPRNDRLSYIAAGEVASYFDEIAAGGLATEEIGFTGGEPFMNPDFMAMLEDALQRGFRALVLTNAMKPMWHKRERLADLRARFGDRLVMRVSLDHYTRARHDAERGAGAFAVALAGLRWLAANGFCLNVAGRGGWGEPEAAMRAGFRRLFRQYDIPVDADDRRQLVLFPEMDPTADVPEITTACWDILGVDPGDIMCASSRMVVKRKGAAHPVVLSCTLIAYDPAFEMGRTLRKASGPVKLNHPHCATFCVLGGGACSV